MGDLMENFGPNFKSWVIMGIAVMAFFIAIHVLAAMLPQNGVPGAIRAAALSA